jgi:hypothetical protein
MSAISELDSSKILKLLTLRLDALEQIIIEDLKIPPERIEKVFMEKFSGCLIKRTDNGGTGSPSTKKVDK